MSETVSPVTGRHYGLAVVCRLWRVARSGVYRHLAPPPSTPPTRRGPIGPMPDAALLAAIRAALAASPFHGEGHRKVWARLRHRGARTSRRRVLRLMREHGLLAPSRAGAARGPRAHDGTIVPETPDTMWGSDLTAVWTGEGPAAVFVAVGHCTAECVGTHAAARATRFEALEPIRQGVRQHFGGFAPRTSPKVSPCDTTMARNTCRTTFRRSWRSSASRVRQPSSVPPRATVAPSGSFAR